MRPPAFSHGLRFGPVLRREDLSGFERALGARWPYPFAVRGTATGCRIPSGSEARNPTAKHTPKGNASLLLDDTTRARAPRPRVPRVRGVPTLASVMRLCPANGSMLRPATHAARHAGI